MRIVQLSDIHLSSANITDLRNYFLTALVADLKVFHSETHIDVILFTGDLVDKGGESLVDKTKKNPDSCYQAFISEVINPIKSALQLENDQLLAVPGNHD
ncbi:MAG: metallophosphoesterase, partial [Sphingobacteriales bacterium]